MPTGVGEAELVPAKKKNIKRKRKSTGEDGELRKTSRFDPPENETKADECSPWNNLDLVLSLQDKNTEMTRKVDLAYDYVKSSDFEKMDGRRQSLQVLNTSRTIVFLNNWVQSVLISSEKKTRFDGYKAECDDSGSFLDIKCWTILQFCLKESKSTDLRLAFSKDFLRVINCIIIDASSCIEDIYLKSQRTFSTRRMELYGVVLDCTSLILSSHGGVANANLDLWILVMKGVLDNVIKVTADELDESKLVNFVMQLSCYLLEPFAKFLRLHPTRKSGFHDFIDKLLEPMLQLLHLLNSSSHGHHVELKRNLVKLIEEVLGQGLFHPTHIDGFLSLQGTSKYKNSSGAVAKEEKSVNRSYHRHFFDVVEKIIAKKNGLALAGLGELLHLFVICAMKHKEASANAGGSSSHVVNDTSRRRSIVSEIDAGFQHVDTESRKCIFDFFVQIMEYLLIDVKKHLDDGEVVSVLSNVPITLISINSLLATYVRDKLYLRTEDASEGACRNFLQLVSDVFTSLFQKYSHQPVSSLVSDEELLRENFISVIFEIIAGVHHLLDIEYEVFGSDLESIWSILFSSMACFYTSVDVVGQPLLFSQIIRLSCRLIDLYSELRQVKSCIFALCRAVRNSVYLLDSEASNPSHCSSYLNLLSALICSLDFRRSLSNAALAIPEGQVAECIRQLNSDVIESLEWIKLGHQSADTEKSSNPNPQNLDWQRFSLQVEILGRVLSEVYTVLLKSTTVSFGNSYLVGVALKSLMDTLQPILSSLVLLPQPNKNLSVVIGGRVLSESTGRGNLPMCWILVFSLQLSYYCRFSINGAICLMPPDTSVKMSNILGDSFTAFSGNELLKMAESAGKGYIPWIPQPSETLNLLHSISDLCIQDSAVTFAPLVYISNIMAIQRLNDLNRAIKSLQFLQELPRVKLEDDANTLSYLRKCISRMRKEALGLVNYIMGCLSTMANKLISATSADGSIDHDLIIQHMGSGDGIDIYVGPMDDELLPSALWCIVCRNADIWFPHASKGDSNKFLKLLIQDFCISLGDQDGHFRVQSIGEVHFPKELPRKFLNDVKLYDQQFLVRHMAPRICRILQKSVASLFSDVGFDLRDTPDWVEVISALKNSSNVDIGSRPVTPTRSCNKRKPDAKFNSCKHLISLFMRLPKEYLAVGSKSSSINYILNLERVLLGNLLGWYDASCSNDFEIFRLFHTCRSVLRLLTASLYETNANWSECPLASKLQDCSFLSWLLESLYAVIRLSHAFRGADIPEEKHMIFSSINSTSDIWLTTSRYQCGCAMSFNLFDSKQNGKREDVDLCIEESDVSECNLQLGSLGNSKTFQSIFLLTETLKDDMQNSVSTFQNGFPDSEKEGLTGHREFNKFSSMVACFHGLFSGLASSLRDADEVSKNFRTSFLSNNPDLVNRINSCTDAFVKFAAFFMNEYVLENYSSLGLSPCGESLRGTKESPFDGFNDDSNQDQTPPNERSTPSEMNDGCKKFIVNGKCHSAISELESLLTNVQHKKRCGKELLLLVAKGENAEAAFFLHHLFIAFSVVLRMSQHISFSSTLWNLYPDLVDISRFLLSEFSRSVTPLQSGYFWLNGVVKFLEELSRYFPKFDPSFSRELYVDLIDLHIRAIGKCILLQGKSARLDSQWAGSTMVSANEAKSQTHSITGQLVELQRTLRSSFRTYIMEPSNLQLRSSLQAVERALVGSNLGLLTNYEILCGSSADGGHVSLSVAGAIDCLALILEDVKGHQRLKMLKRNIHSFVACLFNIILHLQGPNIFHVYADSSNYSIYPDSGSVTVMCIEVLTRIYGKASHFNIDESHIAQSLRVPGAVFQYFLQLLISEGSFMDASVISTSCSSIDWKLSVELYNACCCLLCAALKHHKSETSQFVAILENSVGVLLHLLEIVNTNPDSRKDTFAHEVRNALTCATSLRRVYEELRQQKDVFAPHAYQFLSRYIHVYCGFGPAKKGIIREIDDTLKPGVYALIDICSPDDLQLLHTMFGEGPCRSTLGALQHDYKVHFQFKGKI